MSHYIIKLHSFIFICLFLTACGGGQAGDLPDSEIETGVTDTNPEANDIIPVNASILHWSAPVLFENGDTVSPADIGGFKIYKGNTADSLTVVANVADTSLTHFDLNSLGPGTFYFAVTVYDIHNNESMLSTVLYLTIS